MTLELGDAFVVADAELARLFGGLRLDQVLFEISKACRGWLSGELKASSLLDGKLEQGHPMFLWLAAECARNAIWHCPAPSFSSGLALPRSERFRGWQDLLPLMDRSMQLHLKLPIEPMAEWTALLSSNLMGAMGQIWLRQYVLQRSSPFRLGQALLMYETAVDRRAKRDPGFDGSAFRLALEKAIGADLRRFLLAVMHVYGHASSAQPNIAHSTLVPYERRSYDDLLGQDINGVHVPAHSAVLERLGATPARMMTWCREQIGAPSTSDADARTRLVAPNPLTQFPLVACHPDQTDHYIAPVPGLLFEWLYEPLMDLVGRTAGPQVAADVFEEYVGLVADLCAPDGQRWLHEDEFQDDGGKVVDWARVVGDSVVLIDAKRLYVQPVSRVRWSDDDWRTVKKGICTAIIQAHAFWERVRVGAVAPLKAAKTLRPLVVVVTQGDSTYYASAQDWRAEIQQRVGVEIPWVAVSLDTYELLMTAWSMNGPAWLATTLSDYTSGAQPRVLAELPRRAEGPIWQVSSQLIDDFATKLGQAEGLRWDGLRANFNSPGRVP